MDLTLTETQESIFATFDDYLTRECPPAVVRESEAEGFSADVWQGFVELGASAMGVREEAGGLGLGLLELGLVARACGRALAPVPFIEVACATRLIASLSSESAVLADALEGRRVVSLAIRRPHRVRAGSPDVEGKMLVPYGAVAATAFAIDGERLLAFEQPGAARLVDLGSGAHAYWDAGSGSELVQESSQASLAYATAESEWKLLAAFWLGGIARRAVEIGAQYAQERLQFGRPIGSFQAIAHPLADALTRVEGAELLAEEAAWAQENEPERFSILCSMAYAWASQTARVATGVSLHTHGGYGFSTEYDIQLYYRRAAALASLGGGFREELQSVGVRAAADLDHRSAQGG